MNFSNLTSQDWQHLGYSTLILISLLIGLNSRKALDAGEVLKYLGIWSGIGIILIALYSYRYEFSDFKNRILGEINPSFAQLNEDSQIVINSSQDGHFYIDAKINEIDVRFMVDTGASDIAINLKDAQRIGIDTKNLTYNLHYQTANGISSAAGIKINELEIANIKFKNLSASVNKGEMGSSLLGMSFFRQLKKYEFYQNKLILTIF